MNCKQGDLAWVVSVDPNSTGLSAEIARKILGIPVRVTHLRAPNGNFAWLCNASQVWNFERPIEVFVNGEGYEVTGCADDLMRPIRGQGEDSTDEVTRPVRDEVHA